MPTLFTGVGGINITLPFVNAAITITNSSFVDMRHVNPVGVPVKDSRINKCKQIAICQQTILLLFILNSWNNDNLIVLS